MRTTTFAAILASLAMAVTAVPQGFNCKSEGFCTYSDPNCNFCLNIDPASKLKVCQAIDPTYRSAPGAITRGPSGADFQCVVTCCH
ncbi:hypothetical protein CCHL11_08281 [Colletotrichum chlorophyti]|uniref:Uncharacterized protein n=1 Tax=Colletotrichum chlorophyti TaxID=708187 RepID=A0A1Q8RMX4_9PEZI|nr:hypothetical protein CCHL11_08281 [Colletotrichum chlorophyti]